MSIEDVRVHRITTKLTLENSQELTLELLSPARRPPLNVGCLEDLHKLEEARSPLVHREPGSFTRDLKLHLVFYK